MMKCEKVVEIEDSYLLGELEGEQMNQIEQHLKECSSCRQRLQGYEELLGQMFKSIAPLEPPADIREAVIAHANQTTKKEKSKRNLWPSRSGFARVLGAGIAAYTLALLAFSLILFLQVQDLNKRQEQNQKVLELTSLPDTLIWLMTPGDGPFNPAAPRARMYARQASDIYLVTAINLTPAPAGKAYQMWYVIGDRIEAGGVISLDERGTASLIINDPDRNALKITSCYITLEDNTLISPQPTSPPLLSWKK
jgi:hypothetical protein